MTDAEVLRTAAGWLSAGRRVALATVVETWGSAPRAVGSHLAIESSGDFAGSVSGGCVEGAVVEEACAAIHSARTRELQFSVSDEQAWEVGLACGGKVRVFVEPLSSGDTLDRLLAAVDARRPVARVTRLADGEQVLVSHDATSGALALTAEALAEARALLSSGRSARLARNDGAYFARSYAPPLRVIIVGAVHVTQALAPMAALAGFEVIVIDPRLGFATAARFPSVTLRHEWPDEALRKLTLDEQCAVVAVTHDPKLDDPALLEAVSSPAFYVGALGSRRTHAGRVQRLSERTGAEQLARIRAPVGLDLGGRSPGEIAVSILAEIIQTRYGSSRGSPVV